MALDRMYDELLPSFDAFAHSSLERAALAVTVMKLPEFQESERARHAILSHPPQNGRTAIELDFDNSGDKCIHAGAKCRHIWTSKETGLLFEIGKQWTFPPPKYFGGTLRKSFSDLFLIESPLTTSGIS